jgi:hypothetical protein
MPIQFEGIYTRCPQLNKDSVKNTVGKRWVTIDKTNIKCIKCQIKGKVPKGNLSLLWFIHFSFPL